MNTVKILERAIADDFTYDLFNKLSELVNIDGLFLYIHHGILRREFKSIVDLINNDDHNIFVLGLTDHYCQEHEQLLEIVCKKNQSKQFLIISSVESLKNYLQDKHKNIIDVLCWGGDWTHDYGTYRSNNININKSNVKFIYSCFMRRVTFPRRITLSMLFGLNLDKHGLITARDWFNSPDGLYCASLPNTEFYTDNDEVKNLLKISVDRELNILPNLPYDPEFENTVFGNGADNFSNFNIYLKKHYESTLVDIVVESILDFPFFTEKTAHAFYAKSIPIILAGYNSIKYLRNFGFDMFDDIVDHSYDDEKNITNRIYLALTKNLRLLSDNEFALEKYKSINQKRFEHNIDIVKNRLTDFYEKRLIHEYQQVITKYIEGK